MEKMIKPHFKSYMHQQIEAIKSFKEELENRYNQQISSDRAARIWIDEFANRFRGRHSHEKSNFLNHGENGDN